MNITNEYFDTIKHQIISEIESCEFVALDLELTGLHATNMSFIGTEIAYYHHRKSATEFLPIQIGLCLGHYIKDSNVWELKPYNFYIFPSDNRTFVSSTASIKFLGQNQFDFNHWVKEGIPFLGKQEEQIKRKVLDQRYNVEDKNDGTSQYPAMSINSPEDKEYVQSKKTKVRRWLARVGETPDPLYLEESNPYRRKLLYQSLSKEFPDIHLEKKVEDSKVYILVYNMSTENLREFKTQKRQKESELIDKAVGFRIILDKILECKKPMVGHNCFFDLIHIYQTFIANLPERLPEFRKEFQNMFPLVFDTKLIAERNSDTLSQIFGSSLGSLSVMFDSIPHYVRTQGFEQYTATNSNSSHEAGFDAFMTAHIFLNELAAIVGGNIGSGTVESQAIASMANCVRLVRTTPRSIQLDLGSNPDEESFSGNNALHLSKIPRLWRYQDVARLFHPEKVNVRWIDESSLWALISKRKRRTKDAGPVDMEAVLNRVQEKAPDIVVQTHEEYMSKIGYDKTDIEKLHVGVKRKRSSDESEELPPVKRQRYSCCIQ